MVTEVEMTVWIRLVYGSEWLKTRMWMRLTEHNFKHNFRGGHETLISYSVIWGEKVSRINILHCIIMWTAPNVLFFNKQAKWIVGVLQF